jgi:hypothetical protein
VPDVVLILTPSKLLKKASGVPFWKPVSRPLTRVTLRPAAMAKVLLKQSPAMSLAPLQPLGTDDRFAVVQEPLQSVAGVSRVG